MIIFYMKTEKSWQNIIINDSNEKEIALSSEQYDNYQRFCDDIHLEGNNTISMLPNLDQDDPNESFYTFEDLDLNQKVKKKIIE